MAKLQLFGGEKDGWEMPIAPGSTHSVFYAVPNLDEDLIKKTKGDDAKQSLREKLAVLAYKYDEDRSTKNHVKMIRCPQMDKVRQL